MEHRITHACGHEQVHYLPNYPAPQRARRLRWLPTTSCRACFDAGRRAEEAKAAARDGAAVAALALPELSGSERQVAWAAAVRVRRLAGLVGALGADTVAGHPCLAVRDARWWIDGRDLADAALLAAATPTAHAATSTSVSRPSKPNRKDWQIDFA